MTSSHPQRKRLALPVCLLGALCILLPRTLCQGEDATSAEAEGIEEARELDAVRGQLKQRGIATDEASLLAYLEDLGYRESLEEELESLLWQLGADKFADRQGAQEELTKIGYHARGILLNESSNPDPEVRARVRQILEEYDYEAVAEDIHAASLLLSRNASPRVLRALMNLQPAADSWTRAYLVQLMHQAVKPADRDLIEAFQSHSQIAIRESAILVSQALLEPGTHAPLLEHLKDEDPRIRFAAARALGNAGDRRSLAALLDLLSTEDARFFDEVDGALAALTGHHIAGRGMDQRRLLWRTWLEEREGREIGLFSTFTFFNEAFLRHSDWKLIPGPGTSLKPSTWTFLPDGVLQRVTQNGKTTAKDTWELQGSKLVVVINDYATYTGHVARPNRIEGTAINVKNKQWDWHCERLPAKRAAGDPEK